MSEETISSFGLSPQQRHAWLLAKEHPTLALQTSGVVEIRGAIEAARLEEALSALPARFEILRTRVRLLPGTHTPVQSPCELDELAFEVERADHSALAPAEAEERLAALKRGLREGAADLESGSVFRAISVRLAADHHLVLLAFPSIAGDVLSVDALAEALADDLAGNSTQESAGAGAVADDEAGGMQYADVAQWLQELFESDEAEQGLAHWRRSVSSRTEVAALPGERRPAENSPYSTARESLHVSAELHRSIAKLAESRDVSSASVYAAAFALLVSRLTEATQLTLELGLAGRSYEGLAQTPGPFWKTVPVGFTIDPEVGVTEYLDEVDAKFDEAVDAQEFFDVDRLGEAARSARNALSFSFLPACEIQAAGCTLRVLERTGLVDPFRLHLTCEESAEEAGGLSLAMDYDPSALDAETVACFTAQLVVLLGSIASGLEGRKLGNTSLLGAQERERIFQEFVQGPAPHAPHATVVEWILERARQQPSATAVVTARGELTYAQLAAGSARLARHLIDAGLERGAFVGIHLDRSPELMLAILGVLRAGGAYVPLPHGYPADRLAFMAEDSGLGYVLTRTEIEAELPEGSARRIVLGRDVDLGPALANGAAEPVIPTDLARPDGPAYVIYTSGSTGRPKGVIIRHRNLVHSTGARLVNYGEGVGAYLLLSSVAFDSSVPGLFWTLVEGGKLVFPRDGFEEELASLPALIAEQGVTHMLGLPSLHGVILESAKPGQLASLTTVIVAGETCTSPIVEKHFLTCPSARLFNEYGPTEATVWGSVHDCSTTRGRHRVPIGRPIPGGSCYVLGPDQEPRPIGVPGELYLGGQGIASGYHNRPELSAERFRPNPYATTGGNDPRLYRTGDLVRFLVDGELEFLGRVDSQVKIRGYRIELEEIESVLEAQPRILAAAVAAREDASGTGILVAFVALDPSAAVGEASSELTLELREALRSGLPEYMVPSSIAVLPELPRLPNGKVDRSRLPEGGGEELGLRTPYAEPISAVEKVLAQVWADVLGKERVGRHDDFFDLGGHSIVATRLYARIRDTLQVELPLRVLFDRSNVAELAEVILADVRQRERVERTAELLVGYAELSDEELAAKLEG